MRVTIIANPVAGGGRGRANAEALDRALTARGCTIDLRLTTQAGDAAEWAAEIDTDCVVSVGGDGTANEVVNGLRDPEMPVAILPMGSANVVARELSLPRNPEALADLLVTARPRIIDLGEHDGRKFLLGAGAGLDAAIAHQVHGARGKQSSVWRWVVPSITQVLRYAYHPIRVAVDGEVISEATHYAIVGNCIYSAGVFPSTPRARIDDGLLDVCLLENLYPIKMAWIAGAVWHPRFIAGRDVVYRQGHEISFESPTGQAVPLQVDGDPAAFLPANFRVLPGALRVVAPH